MKILYFGNFEGPGNVTGELPDERHQAEALKNIGHEVVTFPRDHINAKFKGRPHDPLPEYDPDIILIAKWGQYLQETIQYMKDRYKAPLVYWCWEYMFRPTRRNPQGSFHATHKMMVENCDLYISGERGLAEKYREMGVNYEYFNWDAYRETPQGKEENDLVFPGSYYGEYRIDLLKHINNRRPVKVFSWDYLRWQQEGFEAYPGKYGDEFGQMNAKIYLCANWVEPKKETEGYWSNRIGKVLTAGGFPLLDYVPGMEEKFGNDFPYFHGKDDVIEKIDYWLSNEEERREAKKTLYEFGRKNMTTEASMKELTKIIYEKYPTKA